MDIEVIEPNEYIRTEKGHISQNLTTIPWIVKDTTINGDLVAKHSKNVLDLIEEGDFINKEVVWSTNNKKGIETVSGYYTEQDIKTILTHEQYERNCYRLEE